MIVIPAIKLNRAEVQSGLDRVKQAEGLIRQLPPRHDGRNTWLLNYGRSAEAERLRERIGLDWDEETQSAPTATR